MSILTEVRRFIVHALRYLSRNHVYEVQYGEIAVKRRGGLGYLRGRRHNRREKEFLSSLDLTGKTVFDIGGHIGVLSALFAKMAGETGQVIVFEPNLESCEKIRETVQLNGVANVRIFESGIGDEKESRSLVVRKDQSATGSMNGAIQSQIRTSDDFVETIVSVDTLDNLVEEHGLRCPEFIKIDIEGMEHPALLGMNDTVRRCAPSFYIEIHGAGPGEKSRNIRQIFELFSGWDYTVTHTESGTVLGSENVDTGREGHIYCEARPVRSDIT